MGQALEPVRQACIEARAALMTALNDTPKTLKDEARNRVIKNKIEKLTAALEILKEYLSVGLPR